MIYKKATELMPENDIEKLLDLMAYVRKNPDFTDSDLRLRDYSSTLRKYFYDRVNDLRKAAGLPLVRRQRPRSWT